jgi:hypothetical protein
LDGVIVPGDFRIFLFIVSICVLVPATLSFLLTKTRPPWPTHKVVFLASLPIPALIWVACLFVFMEAAVSRNCGAACVIGVAVSFIIAGAALVGFLVGALAAFFVRQIAA